MARLPAEPPNARLVDCKISAVDLHAEGLLMAPSYGIPRLLARHRLSFSEFTGWEIHPLWEIHKVFAAQVLANVAAITDREWIGAAVGVQAALGDFDLDRGSSDRGSVALGHPSGATGARDIRQAVNELWATPPGPRGIISICADGGFRTVALLKRA